MSYYIEYYKEKDTDPMVFLQRFRCTTEPIGGGTEPDEEGELVSWEAAVAAIEIAKKHLSNEKQFQDFKKEVEKLREINDAEEYAKQLAHLFLGNGLSLQTILLMAIDFGQQHPQWYDAQGDNVPKYRREVIVIGRDGKVFYGHRPDPEEVTMVEGKPYHAKTYDKKGWNWPNIALWLDVEVPDKLIDEITTKWFEENEQRRRQS